MNRREANGDYCESKWEDLEGDGEDSAISGMCDILGADVVWETLREELGDKLEEKWLEEKAEEDYNHGHS